MDADNHSHLLLIISHDCDIYKDLIEQENLPGLSIEAVKDPYLSVLDLEKFDLVFGEPSIISPILDRLINVKWIQSTWAGVEPLLRPGMKRDYILTNVRYVYGQLLSEYVMG